jgi:hypothetical protein
MIKMMRLIAIKVHQNVGTGTRGRKTEKAKMRTGLMRVRMKRGPCQQVVV